MGVGLEVVAETLAVTDTTEYRTPDAGHVYVKVEPVTVADMPANALDVPISPVAIIFP